MSSYGKVYASPIPCAVSVSVMQNAATTNGNGTSLLCTGNSRSVLTLNIAGTATVNFEGTTDDTAWTSLLGVQCGTTTSATSATSSGTWMFDVAGLKNMRARISGASGATVTVTGYASVLSGGGGVAAGGGGGGGNVNLTQINGHTVLEGNGTTGNGSQRMTIASDQTPFPSIVRGDAKGGTSAANVTASSVDADHNALDVYIRGGSAGGGAIAPGTVATYISSDAEFAPASSATDVWTMFGSGTKTIKIYYIGLRYVASGGGAGTFYLLRRSSANSGGTSSSTTPTKLDSNNSSATATIKTYTANPSSLGTSAGQLLMTTFAPYASFNQAVTEWSSVPDFPLFDYKLLGQPLILRGTSEGVVINCNGTSPTATLSKLGVRVIFTEE